MDDKRRIGNRDYYQLSFAALGGKYSPNPNQRVGRPVPIAVEINALVEASKILSGFAQSFHSDWLDSNNRNKFYLLHGGVVEVHERDAFPGYADYIGVLHEEKEGLAYVVHKLALPQDGPRVDNW